MRRFFKRAGSIVLYFVLAPVITLCPIKYYPLLGVVLGQINCCFSISNSRTVRKNLKRVFPEKNDKEIETTLKKYFINHAKSNLETILLSKIINDKSFEDKIEFHGLELVKDTLKKKRGAIFVTGHIGCYHLAGAIISKYLTPINDVAQDMGNFKGNKIDRMIFKKKLSFYRRSIKGEIIHRSQELRGVFEIIKKLKSGEGLSLFIDALPSPKDPVVKFLNEDCRIPSGMIYLAERSKAPLIPSICLRGEDNSVKLYFYEPVELDEKNTSDSSRKEKLKKCLSYIEKTIFDYPEQWLHWRVIDNRFVDNNE